MKKRERIGRIFYMNEEQRKKLVAQRKKEQAERELQYDLNRDLKIQDQINEIAEQHDKERNKYTDWAIIILGTLVPLYLFLFGIKYLFLVFFGPALGLFGLSVSGVDIFLSTFLHILIWSLSLFSVYRERSVMEDILEIFF